MKTVQMGPISTFKQRATHLALGLGLAATLAFGAVMPAMAAPGDGSVTLERGTSTVTIGEVLFGTVTLNGAANQETTVSPTVTVNNAAGVAAGFSITMNAGEFVKTGEPTTKLIAAPRVLSATVDGVADGTTNFAGAIVGTNSTNVIAQSASVTPGPHSVVPVIEIDIPATTQLGAYTSTFTVSYVATP